MASKKDTDSGWAWVVLGASIFNLMALGAMAISIGLFQTEFLKHFEGSTAYASLVCSVCGCLQSLLGPLAGVLCHVCGLRVAMMVGATLLSLGLASAGFVNSLPQLLVCYGFVAGTGFGIVYTPSAIAVGHYFKKKRVLTNGIALSSTGIGIMSGPHLIGWLIDKYGWRFALVVFSCIIAQIIVSGSLMFPLDATQKGKCGALCYREVPDEQISYTAADSNIIIGGQTGTIHRRPGLHFCCQNEKCITGGISEVLRNSIFWILGLHYFLQSMGYSIQIVHFPSYVKSVGVSHTKVPLLFTAYGISLTLARFLCGILCSYGKVNLKIVYLASQTLLSVLVMFMPLFARGFIELIVYEVLFALCYGGSFVLVTPVVVKLFGIDSLDTVFGMLLFLGGLSYLVAPTIAGELYDVTSSYSTGFHIGGLLSLVGSLLLLLIPVLMKRNQRRERRQKEKNDLLVVEEELELFSPKQETHC